jgi:ligand-binding sensor domain-containing protein
MECKLKNTFILLFMLLCFNSLVKCQYSEWTNFSFANEVNAIAEDDSLLWIGTDVGLVSYNKYTYQKKYFDKSNSPLSDNEVFDIAIDKYHNKWLGTRNGLIKFDNKNWEIIDKTKLNVLYPRVDNICIEYDSIIWFCTGKSIWKYSDKLETFTPGDSLLNNRYIKCLAIDSIGNKWIGTSDNGILRFDGKTWNVLNAKNSRLPYDDIDCLYFDKKGRLWVSTMSGLYIFYQNKWKVYKRFRLRNGNMAPSSYIENFIEDNSGNIWLLTSHAGIRKYSGKKIKRYTYWNTNETEINDPKCGLLDSQNNLWFGTQSFGGFLIKYDYQDWQNISCTSYPTMGFWSSVQFLKIDDDGIVWIGNNAVNNALTTYDENKWNDINGKVMGAIQSSLCINDMAVDSKGQRWFVSEKGLFMFDGKEWKLYKDFEPKKKKTTYYYNYFYTSVAIDSIDNIWIGSQKRGLFKFNGSIWQNYNTSNSSIPSNVVSDLAVDSENNIWFGAGHCLVKLDTSGKFMKYDTLNSSFPYCKISKLAFDKSNCLWIGTNDYGLMKYDRKDFQFFTSIDEKLETIKFINADSYKDLKKNNPIYLSYGGITEITDIAFDKSGDAWIGSDGRGLFRITNDSISVLNEENSGLLTDRITSIDIDKNDYKWVGLFRKGISVFK